mgnify:FL=1
MKKEIAPGEGVILEVRPAGEGGRRVRLFSESRGQQTVFVARGIMNRCGPGFLFPFVRLRYSRMETGAGAVLTQYEGKAFFDMMKLSYEEIARWYYVAELVMNFFPEGESDPEAYAALVRGASAAGARNRTVAALILAVQLLALAGSDPAEEEPMERLRLSGEARALVEAFRRYGWRGPLPVTVKKSAFLEAARYVDDFISLYGDMDMKTRGAFLQGDM